MASRLTRWLGLSNGDGPDRSLVGSARQLRNSPRSSPTFRKVSAWQGAAFDMYDQLGEVHSAFSMFGNGLSRVRLFPAWRETAGEDPVPIEDAENAPEALVRAASDEWERLEAADGGLANQGGVSGLISEFAMHLGLVGETYLYGHTDADGVERWEALSVDEVVQRDGRWHVRRSPGRSATEPVGEDDFLLRIWRPHPRWSDLPDSSLRPLLDEGELLLMLAAGDLAVSKSRIGNAGLLYIDSTFSFPSERGTGDPPDTEPASPFVEELVEEAIAPLRDPASASAIVPLVVEGEGPLNERIVHVPMSRPLDENNMKRAKMAIERVAFGVDLPPELILGKGDLNHWTAWQVDEATFKQHLEPTLLIPVQALTGAFLRAALRDEYPEPVLRRLHVWYDPTDLLVSPDRSGDAHQAYENLAISTSAYLRELGFNDADRPEDTEVETRIQIAQAIRARPQESIDVDVPGEQGPPEADRPEVDSPVSVEVVEVLRTLAAAGVSDLGERLTEIDRALLDRLDGAVDQAMRRVLERAGARVRSRAQGDETLSAAISTVDNLHAPATLGRTIISDTLSLDEQELVSDGWGPLGDRFDRWVAAAQEAALETAADAVDADPDDPRFATVRVRQAEDRDEAWAWLRAALTATALALLFSPDEVDGAPAAARGEVDVDSRVGFRTIRESVARAGGAASDVRGAIRDTGVTLRARGVASGVRMLNLLAEFGVAERAIRWDYRPAIPRQSFPPHASLHGQTFASDSDEALTNASSWPSGGHYYPGDHRGCRCTFVPVLASEGGTVEP